MGVDFGAMAFYGFELEEDYDSPNHNEEASISDHMELLWEDNYTEGVNIINADTLGDSRYFIAYNESVASADYNDVTELNVTHDPEATSRMDAALKKYCETNGFVYAQPTWKLVATVS